MATERVNIIITENGSRTVRRNIDGIAASAVSAERALFTLQRVLTGLGVGVLVRELVNLTNSYTNLQNRLRTVTTSTGELKAVTEELFALSNRTRASYETSAEIYARVAASARGLGKSQQELLQFTESLNQAVALSGATNIEASNALIQLSQGLSSGALRGDELRSVLEQLPAVADVIAKSLGVTRGELRQLGFEGKITAETVLKAFAEARAELDERFSKSVPTLAQAFLVLRNSVLQYVGEADTANGVSRTLAETMIALSTNLDTVVRASYGLVFVIGTLLVRAAVGASAALVALSFSNPFTAIAMAVIFAVGVLYGFSDQIMIGSSGLTTLGDVASVVWGDMVRWIGVAWEALTGYFDMISNAGSQIFESLGISWQDVIDAMLFAWFGWQEKVLGAIVGAVNTIITAFWAIPSALGQIFAAAFAEVANKVIKIVNFVIDKVNYIRNLAGADAIALLEEMDASANATDITAELETTLANAYRDGFNMIDGLVTDPLRAAIDDVTAYGNDVLNRADANANERMRQNKDNDLTPPTDLSVIPPITPSTLPGSGGGGGGSGKGKGGGGQADKTFADYLQDLKDEAVALQGSRLERERLQEVLRIEESLKRKLTDTERAMVVEQLKINEGLQAQADILDSIQDPIDDYHTKLGALNALYEAGKISLGDYNEKLRENRLAFLETQDGWGAGLERSLLRFQEDMGTTADGVEEVLTNAFDGASSALSDFFLTGKADFKSFAASIIEDMIRITVQQGIMGPIMGAFGGNSGIAAGGGGIGGFVARGLGGLLGFSHGGDFEVGGVGGVDSQMVSFMATPGEKVTVTPPGQKGTSGSDGAVVNNFYITTPDVEGFKRSEGQISARMAKVVGRGRRNL